MAKHFGSSRFLTAVLITSSLLSCGPQKRYQLLSTFFDGVPTPEERAALKELKKNSAHCPCPADGNGNGSLVPVGAGPESGSEPADAVPVDEQRPAIEQLTTWEEVLEELPTDLFGGPDWVEAVKDGTIDPRVHFKPDVASGIPYTLDSLVPATLHDVTPPLQLEMELVPDSAPFYKVVFPHSSHTLWLNCSSCHPGIVAKRALGMGKIFAGQYCGECHGKVSFDPMTSCARCHVNLVPASPETVTADLKKGAEEPIEVSQELIDQGQDAYLRACAICHGEKGGGKGPLADELDPKPRDFTSGQFKLRSTNSSSIPTDFDLFRTITLGIPRSSMPPFSFLSYEERYALVHFLKTFSERFSKEEPAEPIVIKEPPEVTPEVMETGKQLYVDADCNKCHGDEGRGDGPSADTLEDTWGEPIRPFDFTAGRAKAGNHIKDYYRSVMTGLQGTPMADFGEVFEGAEDMAWALVSYVYSLGTENRHKPPAVKGDIFFERGPENSGAIVSVEETPAARFPHWFHRIRVRCSACHPAVFEMKAGANSITMDKIRAGEFCGSCHPSYPDPNSLAWPVTFDSCARCHPVP